jgi:hypothetical protein
MCSVRGALVAGCLTLLAMFWLAAPALAQPNTPPDANAGPDQVVEATSPEGTPVNLDGSGSSDPDEDVLTYTWTEDSATLAGPDTDATSTVDFDLGVHLVALTVNDGNGGVDTDTVQITVQDTTPPAIESLEADPDLLWPPNHKMRHVTLSAVVTDNADPDPMWRIIDVVVTDLPRDQPTGGPNSLRRKPKPKDYDWAIVDDHSLFLRSERLGRSEGRLYTIIIQAQDASDNLSTDSVDVLVPHDRRRR